MRAIQTSVLFSILFYIGHVTHAQTNGLLAETIDKNNAWNAPFYKPYNNVTVLFSNRTDSTAFCQDCNLASVIWKGIETNQIPVYMPDKKKALAVRKSALVKNTLLMLVTKEAHVSSIAELLHQAECCIYRKATTDAVKDLAELSIEWLSVKIENGAESLILYVRAKESMAYLSMHPCVWVNPANQYIQMNYKEALEKRNYLIGKTTWAAAFSLQESIPDKNTFPAGMQAALKNDTHTAVTGTLASDTDTIQIRLQAMCSASATALLNRGYNKVHLPEILMYLYASEKIKAYVYHDAGYFTPMTTEALSERFLVETGGEEEYTVKRQDVSGLTTIHILKKLTQLNKTVFISNDWLLLGMDPSVSTAFANTYVIAFSYPEVLQALAGTSYMFYSGTNQLDSMKLEEALRTQRIAYERMIVSTIYNDTIFYCTNSAVYKEYTATGTLAAEVYQYAENFRTDFDAAHKRLQSYTKKSNKKAIETYQLNYFFDTNNPSALTKNTALTDLLLDAIRTKKINTYADERLSQRIPQEAVLSTLDKARFYKTGNKRKDSIYISKIPVAERYIKSSELTLYTIGATYAMHSKAMAQGRVIGIFIPAILNPQYEAEVFCYVSYPEFLYFLQKDKAGKKLVTQFTSLLNERAVVAVTDFYEVTVYNAADENAVVPDNLPTYVRQRLIE